MATRRSTLSVLALLGSLVGSLHPVVAGAAERIALVIGNNEYEQARLFNPVNDAEAIGAKFEAMGYDTTILRNGKRLEIEAALDAFSMKAASAEYAMFFYAGHAIQVYGKNYIIPVDARLTVRRDIKKLIPLDDVSEEVGQADKLGVVILDACRDNPFNAVMDENLGRGLVGRGLSGSVQVGGNTLIAYATEEDAIAADGHGRHSPYTSGLLEHIDTPGIDVRLMFGRVRDAVIRNTGGKQRPFVYGSIGGSNYFLNARSIQVTAPVGEPSAPRDTGRKNPPGTISNRDMSLVMDMFSELRSAILSKDREAIRSLVAPSEQRDRYIDYLFDNFSTIEVSLSRVQAVEEKSAIVGRITIDRLVRDNGDIGLPARKHKTIPIESRLIGDDWSPVIW